MNNQISWSYCWLIFILAPLWTHTPRGEHIVCACVCVWMCVDTEVSLCWSYKAGHSGAGGLEPVAPQTAHLPSTFTWLIRMHRPQPPIQPASLYSVSTPRPYLSLLWLLTCANIVIHSTHLLHSTRPKPPSHFTHLTSHPLLRQRRVPLHVQQHQSGRKRFPIPILPFHPSPTL